MTEQKNVRNKLLRITRNIIPYVKELREYTGSVTSTILMQQFDYWFDRYPEGFYKFLKPSHHEFYKQGQSWIEELAFTETEFRTAFDRIGQRWSSKSQFEAAEDKFQGKFYASYVDNRSNLTYYFRNHDLVDNVLDEIIVKNQIQGESGSEKRAMMPPKYRLPNVQAAQSDKKPLQLIENITDEESSSAANDKSSSAANDKSSSAANDKSLSAANEESSSAANEESSSLQMRNPHLPYTDITTETTRYKKPLLPRAPPTKKTETGDSFSESSSRNFDNFFSKGISQSEREAVSSLVAELSEDQAIAILDEIVGLREKNLVKVSLVSLAASLVKKAQKGSFMPSVGLEIAEKRKRKRMHQESQAQNQKEFDERQISLFNPDRRNMSIPDHISAMRATLSTIPKLSTALKKDEQV